MKKAKRRSTKGYKCLQYPIISYLIYRFYLLVISFKYSWRVKKKKNDLAWAINIVIPELDNKTEKRKKGA